MPPPDADSPMLVQIFTKQTEQGVQLAVILERLKALADYETRIRALERFRYTLAGLSLVGGIAAGSLGYLVGWILGH